MGLFVLVGGWPGSGKSTLAQALAETMAFPLLGKDQIMEARADALGRPETVMESRRLGKAAVFAMLRVARGCPSAVMDSTWFEYSRPLLAALPGPIVEVRCVVPLDVARSRYRARAGARDPGHLDRLRTDEELWGRPSEPLGVGTAISVDTAGPVDIAALAATVMSATSK